MSAHKALKVNAANFDTEVLQSDVPVLVDFWAPWCGPCLAIAPVIESLAGEFEGRAKVVKLNTDENQELAFAFNIRSIPTLMIFSNGEPVEAFIGLQPKGVLADKLNYYATASTVEQA